MKQAEEIYSDALSYDEIPETYNIFEVNCFMSLKILLKQFYNGQVTKERASLEKNKIYKSYEDNMKKAQLYEQHILDIKATEDLRVLLRKQLNEKSVESLETALKLIELYSKERWEL